MKKIISVVLIFILFSACEIIKQVNQMANLANCDFRLKSIEQTLLAGIYIQHMQSFAELSFSDVVTITNAIANKTLPLEFILNIEVRNPNTSPAAMNKMEWILLIDDQELLRGFSYQRVEIPANGGIAIMPLKINMDLMQVLTGVSLQVIKNFGFDLAGNGNGPTRIKIKAKPTIMIGNHPLTYPGYITITPEFSS
ncbi:MAG: hypothetical protein NT175_05350 [Bacteroidetes bacterium]|nr:hypothetical protein [Bacteroidota bacterium]